MRYFHFIFMGLFLASISTVAHAEPKALVKTAPVREGNVTKSLVAYGDIEPDTGSFQAITVLHDAIAKKLLIRQGQHVASGEELVELASAPDETMSYMQAKTAADFARQELARIKRLYDERLASSEQLSAARRALGDADASLNAKRQSGSDAKQEKILAPFAGVVTNLKISSGDRIAAGTAIMNIASSNSLIARLGLNPDDAAHIAPGQKVVITAISKPDTIIQATIARINGSAINPATRLIDAFAVMPENDSNRLIVGDFVKGTIGIETGKGLIVPRQAVLRDDKGAYVFVVRDGRARRIAVEPGIESDESIAVKGDITPQDKVVILGNYELTDAMPVQEEQE